MSLLNELTKNIRKDDKKREVKALVSKWEQTGLLEGVERDRDRDNMAVLLENQAKELLREATTMAGGDVEGFASVAFPLVRRVFGHLIANEIVSVQPMALPTGLVFFLDFTYHSTRLGNAANTSVYGGGVVAGQITGGANITGINTERSFYNLNNGYSSPTGSATVHYVVMASGTVGGTWSAAALGSAYALAGDRICRFDPDITGTFAAIVQIPASSFSQLDLNNLVAITPAVIGTGVAQGGRIARRLTQVDPFTGSYLVFVLHATGSGETPNGLAETIGTDNLVTTYPINDNRTTGVGLGSIVGTTVWGLENEPAIPEINLQVDSTSITADTKKLKAKWTPEAQQDLSAYQNVDAEVELTQILSEHVTYEINAEILEDLVKGATAGTYYWSRRPGRFVNRTTGADIANVGNELLMGADFTGNVSEWYETLIETINDLSAQIHRKTLRGGANFIVVSAEMANILEMTAGFRASVTHDEETGETGTVKIGSIKKKWQIYVDPQFYRNVILVGRKGSSFLESGYAFCPYVPLQVSPTILGQDDFVPRKAVWTRYGKKMIRPDFFGLVIVKDFLG